MTRIFNSNIPDMVGKNAMPYTEQKVCHCHICHLAQSNIWKVKKISKEFNKPYVQYVWKHIESNLKLFTKKKLMKSLDIKHISNGVLQDKALSILVMLGYIRKEKQILSEKKFRFIYVKNIEPKPVACYDQVRDKHIEYDWFNRGTKSDYKGEEDDNRNPI
jgi:hypothetical protein